MMTVSHRRSAVRIGTPRRLESSSHRGRPSLAIGIAAIVLAIQCQPSWAGPARDRLEQGRTATRPSLGAEEPASASPDVPHPGVRVIRDVPYGTDRQQRLDVYLPADARGAPVIFMVHGGAWLAGDKGAPAVVAHKVARWVPKGFIFISTNYRLWPKAAPLEQARDVAAALAFAQEKAPAWGGAPGKFIVMGHSAGAHLVSLLAASASLASAAGARPWLGTVALDSAAYDVVTIMKSGHYRFYDRAFGSAPAYWESASPLVQLTRAGKPFLAVCSSLREDSCNQAARFVDKANSIGMRAARLEQPLSHHDINEALGEVGAYTTAVETFLRTLDGSVAARLAPGTGAIDSGN
jgi:arylformamidase